MLLVAVAGVAVAMVVVVGVVSLDVKAVVLLLFPLLLLLVMVFEGIAPTAVEATTAVVVVDKVEEAEADRCFGRVGTGPSSTY